MWEHQYPTTLWAFTACYRDSFTFTFMCCSLLYSSYRVSNIEWKLLMWISFMCKLSFLVKKIWYLSKVVKCFPFFPVLIKSIMSAMVPYLCPMFNIWFEYLELLWLFLITCYVFCICCQTFFLFVPRILMRNLGISFCKCRFCCICLCACVILVLWRVTPL
jgi:hypothetical protein